MEELKNIDKVCFVSTCTLCAKKRKTADSWWYRSELIFTVLSLADLSLNMQ